MTKDSKKFSSLENNVKDLDNICDECKEKNESVSQNLILMGFKICNSCKTAKTIFFTI